MEANEVNGEGAVLSSDEPLDLVLRCWSELAAVAWEGHLTVGRGHVVMISDGELVRSDYMPGPPCRCHAKAVEQYDPGTQAVIVLRHGEGEEDFIVYVLGGWPEPPAAYATVSADSLGAVVH